MHQLSGDLRAGEWTKRERSSIQPRRREHEPSRQSLSKSLVAEANADADNEKDSIGSAPAKERVMQRNGRAGVLPIEFIERSRNESLGIE